MLTYKGEVKCIALQPQASLYHTCNYVLKYIIALPMVFMAIQPAVLRALRGRRRGSTSRGNHIALYLGLLTTQDTSDRTRFAWRTRYPPSKRPCTQLGCGQAGSAADKRSVVWLRCSSEGHSLRRRDELPLSVSLSLSCIKWSHVIDSPKWPRQPRSCSA